MTAVPKKISDDDIRRMVREAYFLLAKKLPGASLVVGATWDRGGEDALTYAEVSAMEAHAHCPMCFLGQIAQATADAVEAGGMLKHTKGRVH
jgi:hypothetical protein